MAGKGGGAWKVAYADFVTAMMAFFLVMWIVGQNDQVKEAIAHHFSDPFAKESTEEDGTLHQRPPKHAAPARTSNKKEKNITEAGGSQSVLMMTMGGGRTSIGTVVHFADDSDELDAEARRRLGEIAPLLVGKPQKVEIRGHCSRRPLTTDGKFEDHWQLSYARCITVMKALEKLGIPRERIRLSQSAGYEPIGTPDAQFPGGGYSRVEVTLLNETTGGTVAQHGTKLRGKLSKVKETSRDLAEGEHKAPSHGH